MEGKEGGALWGGKTIGKKGAGCGGTCFLIPVWKRQIPDSEVSLVYND